MLLTAFGLLEARQTASPPRLVCVGQGAHTLAPAVEAMRLQRHVVLAEPTEAPLEALYEGCIAMVYPSLHEELGVRVLAAMAHGAPIICNTAACLPELVADAALLVDARKPVELADAMQRLLVDADVRRMLRQASRARAHELGSSRDQALRALVSALRHPVSAQWGTSIA
jgi:glycosyltransferase involved in cell wall biosynthesis